MARRRAHAVHANHERWLVSYADFITLLFAFFVVMFASGQTDKQKAKEVSESVREGLEAGTLQAAIDSMMGGNGGVHRRTQSKVGNHDATTDKLGTPKSGPPPSPLAPAYRELSDELKREIDSGQMQVKLEPRGLTISLRQAAFFPSGGESISEQMWPSIAKVASVIQRMPNPVRLEGHTDNRPIHSTRFRSNWDLSTARSIAMLELMTREWNVPASRFAVAGYADTVPIDDNDSDEGRAHNRRVDIVVLSQNERSGDPGK